MTYFPMTKTVAVQTPQTIRAIFERVAPRYDLLNKILAGGSDLYWRSVLVHRVKKQAPSRVLDLATGSGDVLLALEKNKAFSDQGVGADFCLPMLQQARLKKAKNLVVGDGVQLPFRTASFDAVTISFGLRNLLDRVAGLREMARVLVPGGKVYILEFSQPIFPLAPFYYTYLSYVLPRLAGLFTAEQGAYCYLSESIRAFPTPIELAMMMEENGFSQVSWRKLSMGIAVLHEAKRSG